MLELFLLMLISCPFSTSLTTYHISFDKITRGSTIECILHSPISEVQINRLIQDENDIHLTTIPLHREDKFIEEKNFHELFGGKIININQNLEVLCPDIIKRSWEDQKRNYIKALKDQIHSNDEVIKIVDSGHPDNRIDIVFMGDGYTQSERDLFFDDMRRMIRDMFEGQTFAQYLPIFNIWALFRPSKESGLGTGGRSKDTAFKLYREGTELRGVYCGNTWAARLACKAVGRNACDFPSLIANDKFYGGLGGEFTISTSSKTSGTIVLRHEMGHNFGRVGEEYDGGYVYSGANSARNLNNLSWKHWLTQKSGRINEEAEIIRVQEYPWLNLVKGKHEIKFKSDGKYSRWFLQLTVSHMETASDFEIHLDGKRLDWKYNGINDRSFYKWRNDENGLSKGEHILTFSTPVSDPSSFRQLCSITLHEYKSDESFHSDNNYIGAYPTWNIRGAKSFRPTNQKCLMRNMLSTDFCSICQENMWLKFFERIEIIDNIVISESFLYDTASVSVEVLQLGQFRSENINGEKLSVNWYKNSVEQSEFNDKFNIIISKATIKNDKWEVKATFSTNAVKYDPKNLLSSRKLISLKR